MATETLINIGTLIESTPGVYGGWPRLAKTGFPIIQLVAELRAGDTIEQVMDAFGLDAASAYAGLAFYLANKDTLDLELDERDTLGEKLQAEWWTQNKDWVEELQKRSLP